MIYLLLGILMCIFFMCVFLSVGIWKEINELKEKDKNIKNRQMRHEFPWLDKKDWEDLKKHTDRLDEDHWKNR